MEALLSQVDTPGGIQAMAGGVAGGMYCILWHILQKSGFLGVLLR